MTDDDAEEDGSDAAALAFAALRAEIAALRHSVEAMEPALKGERGPDYSPTLGALAASLEAATSRLELIEQHTGAALPVEVARREIARVYDTSLRPARGDLERATREVQDAAQSLADLAGQARSHREQLTWLVRIAIAAVVAGFVAFPLLVFPLARTLPIDNLPDRLAALALGTDRWTAGTGLMSRADPGRWGELIEGYAMARATGGDLKACYETAQKAGREQRCSVTIKSVPSFR